MTTWKTAIDQILVQPPYKELHFSKNSINHPKHSGFQISIGDLQGQVADYRLALKDGRGIHVREFRNYFTIHWDKKDPTVDPIGHLIEDATHWLLFLGIAIVGTFYWYRSKKD